MKYILPLFIFCFFLQAKAQNAKYITLMQSAIAVMDTSQTPDDLQNVANTFERIAGKETAAWLPDYYIALCNTRMAYIAKKKMVDDYCDKAEYYVSKADSLNPNNSEIYVVKAMINSARIMVNPASRGAKYGGLSNDLLRKAKDLDSNNPRIPLQQGMGMFYTPKMFGGGKDKAAPLFSEAIAKFSTFKPADSIAPNWGETLAKAMLTKCNEDK